MKKYLLFLFITAFFIFHGTKDVKAEKYNFYSSFENARLDTSVRSKQGLSPETIFPKTPNTQNLTLTTYDVVFAIEQQTKSVHPDAENKITQALITTNNAFSNAGIPRQFRLSSFQYYNKMDHTDCQAANSNGLYMPNEFCNHPASYFYVTADETSGSNYNWGNSVEWHGYQGIFGTYGMHVLTHELGHSFGLPDFYWVRNAGGSKNQVNGQAYLKYWAHFVMSDLESDNFTPWAKEIIIRHNKDLTTDDNDFLSYQPTNNVLEVTGNMGCKINDANIAIYTSLPDTQAGAGTIIDSQSEYEGKTDAQGQFSLGGNPLGFDYLKGLKIFLIKISYKAALEYKWLDLTDINLAYFSGQTGKAIYPLQTNFSCPISLPGDINHDGHVDILDLRQLLGSFTSIFDYNLVVGNFGRTR